MHDPLSVYDLASDELRQRSETGYDVGAIATEFAVTAPDDRHRLAEVYADLGRTTRSQSWPYEEPDALGDILASLPHGAQPGSATAPGVQPDFGDRVLGGWLGRIAGCNLGKPVEDGDHWTADRIRSYLELAGAYPLRDYVPVMQPMPAGYRLRECWPETTRGRVSGAARDDDIDYTILGLGLLEQHGAGLSRDHVAEAWLSSLPYLRVFTAERAAYANLLRGVPLDQVADVRNPYREWIGALIRADVFGWALPGQPAAAARLAYVDATLSHRGNGVYGAIWVAALIACAGAADTVSDAVTESLAYVPIGSRLADVLRRVRRGYTDKLTWEEMLQRLQQGWGHYGWVHTLPNAGAIVAALLWGEEDFATTVGLAVQAGWDTDSAAATAGSVAGTVLGARRLPAHLVSPLQDRTRSAVFGADHSVISRLAERTLQLSAVGQHATPSGRAVA